ncbi:DUF1376 domain-containing protein [Lichenicola cladoniae]|uniref:DUF1376 domain-containing protein n=1 Tax=Lichenicola cladoniae TaxID=1484109 RepID=A0A6M8HNA2_9PROT|nr:DUF1376 domain-containing protein [Lichenicola cladoniae]NPD67276.1 DUF1376 domain-containing protein [Acetobacteraceae bacterium]QKE89780.1 DUF1376 domain-containing protein [Lichenicola cladoniae]
MTDLPAPLTPPDCDLRGYDYMPLFGSRLFGSRLYTRALRQPRAGLAAIKLWWMAWQQCPAGSLPDDDDDLAMLADFGTDAKGWRAVRELALHGFVKCSDGRFYHPILCEEAKSAFERRKKERERKARLRSKKDGTDDDGVKIGSGDVPPSVPRDIPGTDLGSAVSSDGRGQDRTGQDKEEEKKEVASLPARGRAPSAHDSHGSRLSKDWIPGREDEQCAKELGLDVRAVLPAFRDYWVGKAGKDARKADWSATWRNWCRREKASPQRGRPGGGGRPDPAMSEDWDRLDQGLGIQSAGAFQ